MTNFNKFFKSRVVAISSDDTSSKQNLPALPGLAARIASELVIHNDSGKSTLTDEQSQNFAIKVSQVLSSDEFIDEISKSIGLPEKDETEDEFVKRSKVTIKTLLRMKLGS